MTIDTPEVISATPTKPGARFLYVGSFTSPNFAPGGQSPSTAEGISVFETSPDGGLTLIQTVPAENPSFLAIGRATSSLYAVNELGEDTSGAPLGRISAYRIDPSNGHLTFLNDQPTQGTWPCHCCVDNAGKHLFAANYGSGSFAVYPLQDDGKIGGMSDLVQGAGNGPDLARQEGPHAHMICEDPGGTRVFGIDLGTDRLHVWKLDLTSGRLKPAPFPAVQTASGSGPRHMAFHPSAAFAYVANELSSSIDVFAFHPERDALIWQQSIPTLPPDTDLIRPEFDPSNPGIVPAGSNTAAEIRMHPDGKWVYVTNRGMDSIVTYSVSPLIGTLTAIDWTATEGDCPRGMNVDPSGRFLYVGNQNSDTIVVFGIDPAKGTLGSPLHKISCPTPVDFAFGAAV